MFTCSEYYHYNCALLRFHVSTLKESRKTCKKSEFFASYDSGFTLLWHDHWQLLNHRDSHLFVVIVVPSPVCDLGIR